MRMSKNGLDKLKEWEGCVLHVYSDSAGLATIGVGHCLTHQEYTSAVIHIDGEATPYKTGITLLQAMNLLAQDVIPAQDAVNQGIKLPMTQNQFDALVSFCFNIGKAGFNSSSALADFNQADLTDIPDDMAKWNKITVNGVHVVDAGLVKRRAKEAVLFMTA
jgi:lysozyme